MAFTSLNPVMSNRKSISEMLKSSSTRLRFRCDSKKFSSPGEVPYSVFPFGRVVDTKLLVSAALVNSMLFATMAASAVETDVSIDGEKVSETLDAREEVRKRRSDERNYQALTLDNGLRVLLISDSQSTRAAAAVDVHVGSLSDADDVPGLAHFCEHMLFLGTGKYPEEGEFTTFLAANGGSSNAYTASEDTVYYFDSAATALEPALARFSQFFIDPLFTADATARELNAIDSEHSKNINNDGFRLYQLDRNSANPDHPFNKFATGNKFTLQTRPVEQGIDVRQKLLEFHGKYYSADKMTLSVIGSQSLSELESWVRRYFSAVPSQKATRDPAFQWWGKVTPYIPQEVASALEVVPVSETRKLVVAWPLWVRTPSVRTRLQRAKPYAIVSHLLGHEGKGSMRSYLVRRGWANGVQATVSEDLSDLQMFEVDIDLTEEGLRHRDDVME
eukprot:gene8890-18404_t